MPKGALCTMIRAVMRHLKEEKMSEENDTSSFKKVFLIDGKRTPFGKFGGSLKHLKPVELSVISSDGLLKSLKLNPSLIDHVIFSNVIPSTPDTLYGARHLGLKLGIPTEVPGYSVNRLCGSGIEAIIQAKRLIQMGDANCVLVSGSENMSMAPHLCYGARFGTKYGAPIMKDLLLDALTDENCQTPMGITAENMAEKFNISREESDSFSYYSHIKAKKAVDAGFFNDEIIPYEGRQKISADEHLREDISLEDLKTLKPSFKKDGVVTPASASGIVDGAASVLIASEEFCLKHGLSPMAEVINSAVVGVEPTLMGIGPVNAINNLLKKESLPLADIDFFEINEAFAPQVLGVVKGLDIPLNKLNIWGGAVALGHPLGATGTRLVLTLARQLKINGKNWGIASACIGGGQGIALLLKAIK